MTIVLVRRGEDTKTRGGDSHVKMKAEIGVTCLQAAPRNQRGGMLPIFPQRLRGNWLWILDVLRIRRE